MQNISGTAKNVLTGNGRENGMLNMARIVTLGRVRKSRSFKLVVNCAANNWTMMSFIF